jgi:nucleolar protein 15
LAGQELDLIEKDVSYSKHIQEATEPKKIMYVDEPDKKPEKKVKNKIIKRGPILSRTAVISCCFSIFLADMTAKAVTLPIGDNSNQVPTGKKQSASTHQRGIVYFSHIPHGFYEKEMRSFLSQFGTVTNLRHGRSKKTGQSKGYAFVEFLYTDVAKIVVDTMNNYLMFEKLLKCQLVPTEKAKAAIFRGKINPQMPPLKANRIKAKKLVNAKRTDAQDARRVKRQMASLNKLKERLAEFGVDTTVTSDVMTMKTPLASSSSSKGSTLKKTPVMEVDVSDDDISLKTPPHVKKIKSRSNSLANSAAGTPRGSKSSTPRVATTHLNKLLAEKMLCSELKSLASKRKAEGTAMTPGSAKKKEAHNRPVLVKTTPKRKSK